MARGTGITEATVEEIKSRVDLVELISGYGIEVKTAGATKKSCCPFHHEKTPSFNINENKGFYHCFGCGESGDAIKFVMKMEGLSFVEAVRKLAEQVGVKIEEREDPEAGRRKRLLALMAELAAFYHRCLLQTKEAALAREYLTKRDLGPDVQESFLIGYAPAGISTILAWAEKHKFTVEELEAAGVIKGPNGPGDRGYHRFGGRLMFSIRDKQGRVVAFSGRQLVASKNSGKYVNSPETLIFKKSNVLFGFDKAAAAIAKSPHREALVCEGQIDTIRLHISGFPVAVASQGTAFTEEHVRMLKRVADAVTLVFDDDAAGHKATIRTAGLFLAAEMPVRVVSLPGGDDPDSFLRTHPASDFQALLDKAESIMSFQVRAERAKEKDPTSIDALNRIVKATLATVAQSRNEVLKAAMIGEAAKMLGLPTAALNDELSKIKTEPVRTPSPTVPDTPPDPGDDYDVPADDFETDEPLPGEEAATALPPPPRELALCELLLANENDPSAKTLSGMLGEHVPPGVFAHDFTRRFVETWRTEIAQGSDILAPWRETLPAAEGAWFDALLLGQEKYQASGESATDALEDLIRSLWRDHLLALRGCLNANACDRETLTKRMRWTELIKRLPVLKWSAVKDIIRELIEGEKENGSEGSH